MLLSAIRKEVIIMKRNLAILMALPFVIIAAYGISQTAFGQGPAKQNTPFKVAKMVVATGVENREPVGVSETFPSSTEKVYSFLEAKDIAEDTQVTFVWYLGGKEMFKIDLPLKKGPKWRTYSYKSLRGQKGDWKVELKDSAGSTVKSISFKVE
jgi:hypothetical protein